MSVLFLIILLVVLLGVVWLYHKKHTPAPSIGHTPIASLKPVIQGLVDKDTSPPPGYQSVFSGYVVAVNWSDLQPTQNGPIATNNAIDQAITYVRQLQQHNSNLTYSLKLRVFGGKAAPDWVKNLDGAPMKLQNGNGGGINTVGRFWTANYGAAYQDLQTKLATKYDTVPEIREVVIDRCSTFSAEPFVRDSNNKQNANEYFAAGYSVTQDEACEKDQITESQAWKFTHLDLSFNPFPVLNADKSVTYDVNFSESVMDYCRQTLGTQCVLENNSFISPVGSEVYKQLFAKIQQLGSPIALQTQDNSKLTTQSLLATLQSGISLGASSMELHDEPGQSFSTLISASQLAPFNNQLVQAHH